MYKTHQLFIFELLYLANITLSFFKPSKDPLKNPFTHRGLQQPVSPLDWLFCQAVFRAFIHSVNTGFKWVTAAWRDALLFQAETARTSLSCSSRVTRWRKTMQHKGRKYKLQTECRFDTIGTLHPHTIAGAGKRGIQHQLSNFSVTIVVTTSRCWVRLNIMKSNSRRDFDLDWAFQHCSGSLQICQAQTAVQGIHGNECQGRNYLNAPQLPAGQEKVHIEDTCFTWTLHMWRQIEISFISHLKETKKKSTKSTNGRVNARVKHRTITV